jgi:hypothetical protein
VEGKISPTGYHTIQIHEIICFGVLFGNAVDFVYDLKSTRRLVCASYNGVFFAQNWEVAVIAIDEKVNSFDGKDRTISGKECCTATFVLGVRALIIVKYALVIRSDSVPF